MGPKVSSGTSQSVSKASSSLGLQYNGFDVIFLGKHSLLAKHILDCKIINTASARLLPFSLMLTVKIMVVEDHRFNPLYTYENFEGKRPLKCESNTNCCLLMFAIGHVD